MSFLAALSFGFGSAVSMNTRDSEPSFGPLEEAFFSIKHLRNPDNAEPVDWTHWHHVQEHD